MSKNTIELIGTPSLNELKNTSNFPSEERFKRGPVAIIECIQEIPCNPCVAACPFDAIKIEYSINNLPKIDAEKCKGCGLCLPKCPGLAIFLVDISFSEEKATISFPYEFSPLPKIGEEVGAVNREGDYITSAKVLKIQDGIKNDQTPIITIEIPKKWSHEIRSILIPQKKLS